MQQDYISFRDTGCFSKLICDYLDKKQDVNSFYNHFPSIENFKRQILEKQKKTTSASRKILVSVLKKQYKEVEASNVTIQNIEHLRNKTTFTITTGHQLNLFTGPLYFLYKIVSTINLTKILKEQYPKYNFVPVYWMATEDHDFEEINYFNFKGKKVQWNKEEAKGAVGEFSTDGLQDVFNVFLKELGQTKRAEFIEELFERTYLKHDNLASAVRFLANQLFKDYGLVIVDANERALKKQFIPYIKDELLNQTSYKSVSETNKSLSKTYDIQVNPRKINLFYINDKIRERIVFKDDLYKVLNTKISWTRDELINYIEKSPEQFSPNVII